MRMAAFERVRALRESHGHLTAQQLGEGFYVDGQRYPMINPRRGIFKPAQMRFLLSINTVFPKTGNRVWYDDQREVHRQIFDGDQMVDYAFMAENPDAADNRWMREAFESRIPIIYFLGIAPGRYEAILPAFVGGWDRESRRARISFGLSEQGSLVPPATDTERRYALRAVKQRLHQASFREAVITAYRGRCALSGLPEPMLLDAAHIVEDRHELLGQPLVQRHPAFKDPSRCLRCPLNWHRPRLSIARLRTPPRPEGWADARGDQRAARRIASPSEEGSRPS
jgi:putative restriction endonuclease